MFTASAIFCQKMLTSTKVLKSFTIFQFVRQCIPGGVCVSRAVCDTALDHTCPRLMDQPVPQGPLWTLQWDSDGTAAEQGHGHARPPHPTLDRDPQLTANCHTTWGPAARARGSRREALQRSGQRSRAVLSPQTPLPQGTTRSMAVSPHRTEERGRGSGVAGEGQGHGQLCDWPAVGGGSPHLHGTSPGTWPLTGSLSFPI